jgi:hypothetical protein
MSPVTTVESTAVVHTSSASLLEVPKKENGSRPRLPAGLAEGTSAMVSVSVDGSGMAYTKLPTLVSITGARVAVSMQTDPRSSPRH